MIKLSIGIIACGMASNMLFSPDAGEGNGAESTNGETAAPKGPALPPRLSLEETQDWEVNSLGVDFKLKVPATAEAFDKSAGQVGRLLEEGTNNVIYRGYLPGFRDKFVKAVEAKTGIKREMVADGDKTTTIKDPNDPTKEIKVAVMKPAQTDAKYLNSVYAKLSLEDEAIQNEFGALAQSIADGLAFDASKVERQAPTPKKTPESYLLAADNLLSKGMGEKAVAKFTEMLKPATPITATRESLGKAIQLIELARQAAERKAATARAQSLVEGL